MKMNRILTLVGCGLFLIACRGLPDRVTNTGYEGTWQRGNERVRSRLAIVKHNGEYLVRPDKTSADGTVKMKCDWDGKCEEFVEGEKTSDLTFRAWIAEERGYLRIECKGQVYAPSQLDIHYIHELKVRKQGTNLRSWTILDQNGEYAFREGAQRNLTKICDYVRDPPEGWRPQSG
jgi:hypothetical protein